MNRALSVDSIILERDQVLRVTSIRPEISQIVLQGSRGEEFVLNTDDFQHRFAQGQYRRVYGPTMFAVQPVPVRNLTQSERNTLDQRLELLENIDEARRDGCSWAETVEHLKARCNQLKVALPCTRTLQRWRKSSSLASSMDQLAPRFSARGNKRRMQTLEDLDFEETVTDEIMRSYFQTDKFNVSQITKLVNQ